MVRSVPDEKLKSINCDEVVRAEPRAVVGDVARILPGSPELSLAIWHWTESVGTPRG